MNETTFESAVVGDRVWSIRSGWGRVTKVTKEGLLYVTYSYDKWDNTPHEDTECYYVDGRLSRAEPQTLFWDEIKIVAPVKPKKREKMKLIVMENSHTGDTFYIKPSDEEVGEWCGFKKIILEEVTE